MVVSNSVIKGIDYSKENKMQVISISTISLEKCKFANGLKIFVDVKWVDKPRIDLNKVGWIWWDFANALKPLTNRRK